ncbi:MAG: uroporphyrinogen decarboxylase family protein [Eubacterium sp.]|nr:uroporphyrinogen decarboxylase family protein [Eubacterium sp.]
MKRNMYEWVDEIIASETKKAMPVLSFPAIQKLGISVAELINDSDRQAECLKTCADSVPDAAAQVSFMDLSLEAEAFGSTIRVSDEEVPTVIGSIVNDEDEAEALEVPEVGAKRTKLNIEAIEKAKKLITDRPVFAGVIGPFSLAGRLMDVSMAMVYCFEEPDMVHTVLQKVTTFLINYINAYKETGCEGVVVAEPLAGLLSDDLAEEFSMEYMKKIVDACQDENFLIIYHNCGNSVPQTIETIVNNGCRMFHFGNAIDMAEIMEQVPANCVAMGNVDPASQFRNGTPESIYARTQEVMEQCCKYPNFVISSGCDIPPMSPWENIDAFFKAVGDYYQK